VRSGQGADAKPQNKVIAYYFHGDFRCPTCFKMEQHSRGAVEKYFKDELASGKVVFSAVNTDEKANKHFVRDYGLYAKSLIISLVKDGKEVRSKNLTKIWEYAWDEREFYDYVKTEVESYLKEL
jgi:NADH:ubiquinone oxidoreductase subunit C